MKYLIRDLYKIILLLEINSVFFFKDKIIIYLKNNHFYFLKYSPFFLILLHLSSNFRIMTK